MNEKFAPATLRQWMLWIVAFAALLVAAGAGRRVSWFFVIGMTSGFVIWEITKAALRRNARVYAAGSSRG